MTRSRLKNKFNEIRSDTYWSKYKKKRNCCVSLLLKTKREYFSNFNVKNVPNNKTFTTVDRQ